MNAAQPAILEPALSAARSLLPSASEGATPDSLRLALARLARTADGCEVVIGVGAELARAAFDARMRRMACPVDGVIDAMRRISKPVRGACFFGVRR